jgi:hypothetical protein
MRMSRMRRVSKPGTKSFETKTPVVECPGCGMKFGVVSELHKIMLYDAKKDQYGKWVEDRRYPAWSSKVKKKAVKEDVEVPEV